MHRIWTLAVLVALVAAAPPLAAQRLSELAPGTLVRIVTRSGQTVSGPIAGVRGDSVLLSSTLQSADAALPLHQVQSYEYADGTEPGHGWLGAFIGGTIGMSAALLLSGRDSGDDGSMFLGGGFLRGAAVVLGAGVGFAIGESDRAPRWVLPFRATSAAQAPPTRSHTVALQIRF